MRTLKEIYSDDWDFGCTIQPAMVSVIQWEGVELSARDVMDTYETLLHITPDADGQQEIRKGGGVKCPFFADRALVKRGILASNEVISGGKILKSTYIIQDLEKLKDSYQEFLRQLENTELTFSFRKMKKGKIEVQEAPLLSLAVSIDGSRQFPVSVVRDTVELFEITHPIPVLGEKDGRFADEFVDDFFIEYLVEQKICGKGKSRKGKICYWIEDEEVYHTLISEMFSLIKSMEKRTK